MANNVTGLYLVYRIRSSDFAIAVTARLTDDGEQIAYRGTALGFDDVFDVVYEARVPMSVVRRVQDVELDENRHALSIDDGLLVDEAFLYEVPLPSSDGLAAIVGSVTEDGEVADIAAVDDPISLGIAAIGAATLLCLAKMGLSSWLGDRADDRRVQAGQRARVVIDGTTDAEVSLSKLQLFKAKLRCHLRIEILDSEGRVVDSYRVDED